jgi:hypothetical protein
MAATKTLCHPDHSSFVILSACSSSLAKKNQVEGSLHLYGA